MARPLPLGQSLAPTMRLGPVIFNEPWAAEGEWRSARPSPEAPPVPAVPTKCSLTQVAVGGEDGLSQELPEICHPHPVL